MCSIDSRRRSVENNEFVVDIDGIDDVVLSKRDHVSLVDSIDNVAIVGAVVVAAAAERRSGAIESAAIQRRRSANSSLARTRSTRSVARIAATDAIRGARRV